MTGSQRAQDRLTGKFVPGSRLAAWPFHLLLNLRINARRARSSEPLVQRVQDGWYISGWPHRADVLPEEKELAVIDCTSEYPRCHDRPYLCLPTWDTQGTSHPAGKQQVPSGLCMGGGVREFPAASGRHAHVQVCL